MKKNCILLLSALAALVSCSKNDGIVTMKDGQFFLDGEPYYYVGANYWEGPVLANPGEGGDWDRLMSDFDCLQAAGVTNLRVLAGADKDCENNRSIVPYLQDENGNLNEDLLVGLDRFMAELGRRGMKAILYFNNHCPWSGGYIYYVKRVTGEEPPSYWSPEPIYRTYASKFVTSDECKNLFYGYLETMVSRVNSETGIAYKDDPALFSWQIANEPRAFFDELHPEFIEYMHHSAEIIRSIDKKHMISTGIEGQQGCESQIDEYEIIHSDPLISYLTFHIWPDNWGFKDLYGDSDAQIQNHLDLAEKLGKPLVIEEFGLLRDLNEDGSRNYDPAQTTNHRNEFYEWVFDKVVRSSKEGGKLAGANFWAFAGAGRARDVNWEKGDDLLGDPPFEPQGVFSVFDSDKETLEIIANANKQISE